MSPPGAMELARILWDDTMKLLQLEERGREAAAKRDIYEAKVWLPDAEQELRLMWGLLSSEHAPSWARKFAELARHIGEAAHWLDMALDQLHWARSFGKIIRSWFSAPPELRMRLAPHFERLPPEVKEELRREFEKIGERARSLSYDQLISPEQERLVDELLKELDQVLGKLDRLGIPPDEPPRNRIASLWSSLDCYKYYSRWLARELDKIDEECRKLFGRRCTWLWRQIDRYSVFAAVNDLAAAIHRLAEELRKINPLSKLRRRLGRFLHTDDITPPARCFMEAMNRVWERLKEEGLFAEEDAQALEGYCWDSRCEVRVGSAPGHLTHVVFGEGGIKVEYYDADENVNRVVKELLEDLASCRCDLREREGVFCRCPPGSEEEIAAVLGHATSMDFRLRHSERYWPEGLRRLCPRERVEEILREHEELKDYDEALEYCLVVENIRRLGLA